MSELKLKLQEITRELIRRFEGAENNETTRHAMSAAAAKLFYDIAERDIAVQVTQGLGGGYNVIAYERQIMLDISIAGNIPGDIYDTPQLIPLPEGAKVKILSSFQCEVIDAHLVYAVRQAVRNYVADEMYISPEKFFVTIDTTNAHRCEIGIAAHYYPKCKHCDKRSTQDITGVGDFVCEDHINKEMV